MGSGPPPAPTREELEAGAWFASSEWSWTAERPSAPVTTASAAAPEARPAALSDRVAAILDLAKETPLGPHGQEVLKSALGDKDADVRAAATWVLAAMAAGGDTNAAAEIETEAPARPVESLRPRYPPAAFVKKIEGDVVLEVLISQTGRVVHARVLQSIPLLDEAALEAVRRATFVPARRGGAPFPSVTRVSVPFRIF
jgi:protein TonB